MILVKYTVPVKTTVLVKYMVLVKFTVLVKYMVLVKNMEVVKYMVRKEAREARMDPPIHAAYCRSPAAVIRILHPLPCT